MESLLREARNKLFLDQAPDEALQVLSRVFGEQPPDLPTWLYNEGCELTGYVYVLKGDYRSAYDWFFCASNHYMAGYCCLLSGDLTNAANNWQPLLYSRPNHWAFSLYGFVSQQANCVPTFLQVRNHFEADLMNLYHAGQTEAFENLYSATEFLSGLNLEAYKFAGRAMLHVGLYDRALTCLEQGRQKLPTDPEVFFHFGQTYAKLKENDKAREALNRCLELASVYVPAKALLEALE